MSPFQQTPTGGRLVLAQAQTTTGTSTAQQKAKTTPTKPAASAGGTPQFEVKPDLSGIPGAQVAGQNGINLVGGLVLMAIVIFTLIGIGRMAVGTGFDMPDHSQGGKKMLLYAVPLAFAASLVGQLVGWGFTLGV
ncbi:hypothetical protein [Patulibacter medicamentivorans]|uniref:hypothetical protein n=1 Tax=Patulibacter medicamentivorans TaxID=1097667 RepID=UPI0011106272|nr:hypothetical protein [Patulibacter medicamentivorans]